jgi:glycine oxidase
MTVISEKKKIALLGAGLVGRLLAVKLAQEACSVHVYEKSAIDTPTSAAHIAAAMLAPLAESVSTEASIVRMGYYSLKRWPEILQSLDTKVFFQQLGSLIVWHQQDQSSATHFRNQLGYISRTIPELPKPQLFNKFQLSEIEPELSHPFEAGIYLPEEGQLDNRELLQALLIQCQKLQVQFHWNHTIDLKTFAYSEYDHVIDCRGIGSKNDLISLRGVRGEVARVYAPEVHLTRPIRLIHPKYPLYIAPKTDHTYVIGATEIESEDDSPMSVRSSLELLSAAYTVHSGFAEARILELAAQCRPSFKNNLPKITQTGPNLLHINGLYRHGFLIAPAIVDAVLQIIQHQTSDLAKTFQLEAPDIHNEYIY